MSTSQTLPVEIDGWLFTPNNALFENQPTLTKVLCGDVVYYITGSTYNNRLGEYECGFSLCDGAVEPRCIKGIMVSLLSEVKNHGIVPPSDEACKVLYKSVTGFSV